jgi:dienelactone hydrolase
MTKFKLSFSAVFIAILTLTFAHSASAMSDFERMLRVEGAVQILMTDTGLSGRSAFRIVEVRGTTEKGFDTVEATLAHPKLGNMKVLLRGPRDFMTRTDRQLPTMFIASGLAAGKDTIRLLAAAAPIVFVGYEYPYNMEDVKRDPANFLKFLKQTPAQIAAIIQWVSEQGWASPNTVHAMGVSLGGLMLPSSLHIAQKIGVSIRGTILAYTGADVASVVDDSGAIVPKEIAHPVREAIRALSFLHDPRLHVPYLKGRFLSIRADRDQVFPASTSILLEQLMPQPKRIEVVSGKHIGRDDLELIAKTQAIVTDWLLRP